MSSTWMSLGVRCRFGLKGVPAGRVNSPDLRKPKKTQATCSPYQELLILVPVTH